MAVTKTARTLKASGSLAAGATENGTAIDLSTALGGLLTAKITNGATGPTIPCSLYVEVSADAGSSWKLFRQFTALLGNSIVTEFAIDIPASVMEVRARFTGNTAQAVTVEAYLQELTSI